MRTKTAERLPTVGRIEARNLIVDYRTDQGTVRALDCSEFSVEPGSNVAIMGPSGCGKSTLLGLLAGLAVPTKGTVAVGDTRVSSLSEQQRVLFRRRSLGMVYQADNLLPHLTVEENVGLQLAICRSELPADHGSDPTDVLERLGLSDLARRLPDQLSGGQRQRVAVARAIVHGPAVILADEPTGALDADNAERVIELLVEVQRQTGATMVVVTHDPAIGAHLERTVLLDRPLPPGEGDDAH
ncbi:MAG: ABC transporter ATP-binding protein [Acidimicrobiia bacterium]|nr:ABC transporter ATP-binding protein [Acidimicrobiia bacterium]MDH5520040.1 ABC transporter ATP-binding protein [Acidimicrobiia bacterium]